MCEEFPQAIEKERVKCNVTRRFVSEESVAVTDDVENV